MLHQMSDILGVPLTKANGVVLTQEERERVIEKKRVLHKISVRPVALKR